MLMNNAVGCLDTWVLRPDLDRAARLEDDRIIHSITTERFPLLALAKAAGSLESTCPFYDRFAPAPLEEPLDGSDVPILVIGNGSDPATPLSDSRDFAVKSLSNGYLVETSHYKHGVYPQNQCVNEHVHRALIDGALPSARRVVCEEDRTFAPEPKAEQEPAAAGEQIDWRPCGKFGCGSIQVPADYRDPAAGSIRIAVNVHRATAPEKRIGYLLVNPGGPGGSGLAMAFGATGVRTFSDEIVERFDILGFDPRGVGLLDELVVIFEKAGIDLTALVGGGSEPEFACGGPGEQLALLASIDMPIDTPEEIAAGEAAANLCIQSMGPVGGRLHSEYVARDMDEIRKALGAEQISYYGGSYGAELGVWYATLFPDSVRAMVVDSARNPFPSDPDRPEPESKPEAPKPESVSQTAGQEVRLEEALTACADSECPIYNDGDPVGYYRQAAAKMDLVNAAAKHPRAGYYGVYRAARDETGWPDLWQGLFELYENDDPAILLKYARKERYIRGIGASFNNHISCLDQWVVDPENDRATRLEEEAKLPHAKTRDPDKYPLMGLLPRPSLPDACTFYDQFAPNRLRDLSTVAACRYW